jgi:rSAM/selenodomain-associated transferase 1
MTDNRNIYGIVMKFPVPGLVKTRLARDIGEVKAAEIYGQLAERVVRRTRSGAGRYERIIFYSPAGMRESFKGWFQGERFCPQQGDDIGEVMSHAFREMFAYGATKAVLTGTDIPGLHAGIIGQAFSELDGFDVVIGPAKDGGYYLTGMKLFRPELFRGLSWGSKRVYEETVSLIDALGLTLKTLSPLSDLDTREDLLSFNTHQLSM